MKAAMHGSLAWSTPWHELQRKLALGIRIESALRSSAAQQPQSLAQVLAAGSWLSRAQARMAA
jgi:hypothetical protein